MKRASENYLIAKEFRFEAAHYLPEVPPGHKCGRLHGHSFVVEIRLAGHANPESGWLLDFGDISKVVRPIIDDELDHRYLNEISGLENPTSENLAAWLWRRLQPLLPNLHEIKINETCNAWCIYSGPLEECD